MTTRLNESAEMPDVIAAEETLAIQQAAPYLRQRVDTAEVPPLMAPHPEAGFNVLEDEEEAARKGVGTGVGVVPFDKLKETIEHVDEQGRRVVMAELEVPMGLGLGDEAERQALIRLEEERLDEAELRRGGARGAKGVEDIRREVVAKRQQQQHKKNDDDDQAKRRLPSKDELCEEAELEQRRAEVQDDIDATLARRAAGEHKHGTEKERVAVETQVNEDGQMVVDELFNGTINDGSPLEPALDEARSLKSYFGEVLHEANEARRREAEEAERDRRLYYREHGVDDDEWTGADAAERADEKMPLHEAAALGVTDIGLARMVAEEVEAERYNEAAAAERKRRREEDAAQGTPFFPAKRRNSLRGELARQMRADRERDQASALAEERLAREGRSTDEPVVNPGLDVTAEEDVYDYPANEDSVYYTYGAEQLDYGDMVQQDQGDYDTLRPFDGDEDLLREDKQERNERRDGERDGRKVLEEVREEVLALEGCLNAPRGTLGRDGDDRSVAAEAQPLVPKVEHLPAWSTRGMTKADARRRLHRAQRPAGATAAARQDEAKATKTSTNA